jgi:TolB-like protein/DNA-binding winged helix-turn-helix (wHTH) protein/Tfp pilus assembly protein PilF
VAGPLETNGFYEFGPYRADRRAHVLLRDGAIVPLTPKVLDTLLVLVEKRGEVVSKDELLRLVWPDSFVEESNLAQNISVLRKALGHCADQAAYIETIAKRGYRFLAEVRISAAEAAPPELPVPRARPARRISPMVIASAVAILVLGILGSWYYRQRVPRFQSIAVLPLKNLSGDPQQAYFADGITELLTTELAKTLPVRVISRTSAMRYRDTDKALPVIARELNAEAVLEGSVIRSGNRLRVTAQLIHGPSDRHLWAETYDRDLVEALTLQMEIARAVAHEIRASTAPPSGPAAARRAAVNPNAFEDSLRARYYLDQRTGSEIEKAISWYEKAIEEDPAYAPAYAGLADCYNQQGTVMIGAHSPRDTRRMAMAAAGRALKIDPQLAEAHTALAYANLYEWNWDQARRGFERAIALTPNYAPAHLWFAHYLTARGQFDRAQQEVRLAADLDPLSPIMQTQIGWLLLYARRIPEGVAQIRKVLEQNPTYTWALWSLGIGLAFQHDYDAGIETLQKAGHSPGALGHLGMAYGLAGRRKEAGQVLGELLALSRSRYVSPHSVMHVYLGLGDRDKAFEWMEKAYQERTNGLTYLAVWPGYDPVRGDPRYEMYLRRIGLK